MYKEMRTIILGVLLLMTINVSGQCCYCNTYEDFLEGQWEKLDTVYCNSHSKSRQLWWGGNDFTLTTGDAATDRILKRDAFVVMQADTLYVNCRNLVFEKTRFGSGYTKAKRIGRQSLLFVNRIIGSDAAGQSMGARFALGVIGGAIAAADQMKQQVCYVISWGPEEGKLLIPIRLVDDELVDKMVTDKDLIREYYSQKNKQNRILANHVMPILEKAGLFEQQPKK